MEEPVLGLDAMAAAMSMISNGEDVISVETIKVTDIEAIQSEHLMSEVFYECKKDLMANSAIEEPYPPDSDVKVPAVQVEGTLNEEKDHLVSLGSLQKSVSSGSLSSLEWINSGCAMRPNFLDFHTLDLGAALGIRRAYSEGDIQVSLTLLFLAIHFAKPCSEFILHHCVSFAWTSGLSPRNLGKT